MGRVIVLTAFLCILFELDSSACTCIGKMDFERDYNISDIVFIGKVIQADSNKFEFQVYENLKGVDQATYKGIYSSSCDVLPNMDEKWLVYANFDKDGNIFISDCSSSRSFSNVFSSNGYEFVPPPKSLDFSGEEFYLYLMNTTNRELIEFYGEISTLRIKKINADLSEIKSKIVVENSEPDSFDYKFYFLVTLILINTFLFLFFRFK